jgi:HD superfamily phosphohydrolase YqeK
MFNKIKNDPYIIDIYNKIELYEDQNGLWGHHNLSHVLSVVKMVEQILEKMNYKDDFIEEAKIAALLHDIGCIDGKEGHPYRSYLMAQKYLHDNKINLKNESLILEAIKLHSNGFDSNNIIASVLILCDKLDHKKTRMAKAGYFIEGMKETQYINDILISIDNNLFTVKFIVDQAVNKKALEEYYFIPKIFKSIEAFSEKMNLDYTILFNDEIWSLNEKHK